MKSIAIHVPLWLLLGLVMSATATAHERVTLQLKWFHQFQFAGYYAAVEKGFYADEGLAVEIRERTSGVDHIDAVLDGSAQYGVSDSSLILRRLRGRPVVVLGAVFQHSPLVLVTRAADGLLGPYELRGKRVMRQHGVDDAALTAMFHQAGMRSEDIVDVPHTFDDDALLRGEVDAISAYVTNQPYYYASKGLDVHVINPLNYGIDFYGDMLFTSEAEIRLHGDRAQRFLRASLKGWAYALRHKDEVIGWLQDKYRVSRPLARLRHEADAVEQMIRPDLVQLGHLDLGRFNWIANIYRQEGMAPADSTLDGIDHRDYLADAEPASFVPWWLWAIAVGSLTVALLLSVINRRLKAFVAERTRQLRLARDRLQRYIDIVDKHVITSRTDRDGIITYASDAFCRISKYTREELLGSRHSLVRHPDMPAAVYQELWHTIKNGRTWHGELKNRAKDGTAYWVDVVIDPQVDKLGQIVGYTAIRQDITDRKLIEHLSVTDTLTQLFNRRKLDETLDYEVERARRYAHPLSVVLFDVDHFKAVNDHFGHQVGDAVLVAIGSLVAGQIRTTDIAGRWGGEEFLLVCPETDAGGALALAEKLRQAIDGHRFPDAASATCSFGVAELTKAEDGGQLVGRADSALYRAKAGGRNRVELAEGEMPAQPFSSIRVSK